MSLVALGVGGGIGAYKAVEVARGLQRRGHDVLAVMTRNARRFVGPLTFEAITRRPVLTSQFAPGLNADIEHISVASNIDLLVVAPATANVIAKFAHGIADDFLSSLFLATRAPVLIAPAMNTVMLSNEAVQENLQTLARRGVHVVEPGDGYLACGWIGRGRLAEPGDIVDAAERVLRPPTDWLGRKVLVSAGPTYEDLDPVRYIGNRSTGRMGMALADEAARRGADVTLVLGPTDVQPPAGVELVRVRSAAQMHDAVTSRAADADLVIMAAAVADYTPAGGPHGQKLKKGEGSLTLSLERTRDVLGDLAAARGDAARPVLVGFAAETEDVIAGARRKLEGKRVDLVVANDVSADDSGFAVETNRATLVSAEGDESLPLQSKTALARTILDRLGSSVLGAAAAAVRPAGDAAS